MCIFLSLKFYNFTKGIMCIYTVHIFKKIKIIVVIPNLFIYLLLLTELMYLSLKVNKYGKTIFLIFHRH